MKSPDGMDVVAVVRCAGDRGRCRRPFANLLRSRHPDGHWTYMLRTAPQRDETPIFEEILDPDEDGATSADVGCPEHSTVYVDGGFQGGPMIFDHGDVRSWIEEYERRGKLTNVAMTPWEAGLDMEGHWDRVSRLHDRDTDRR